MQYENGREGRPRESNVEEMSDGFHRHRSLHRTSHVVR